MLQFILLGIGAGATASLLFASLASGSLLAIILCFLAPLPLLLVALGWSHVAALIAALTGTLAITTIFGVFSGLAFLAGVGLPGWWLGYLAMLARSGATPQDLEWYPVGHLVFWGSLSGLLIAASTLFTITNNHDRLSEVLRPAFTQMLGGAGRTPASEVESLVGTFLLLAPAIAAVTTGTVNLINLWLAARIVRASGRLKRPWPEIAALALPPRAPMLLAGATAASFLPGTVGWLAAPVAAVLLLACAVVGFAVLHTTTAAINGRPFVLGAAYASVLLLSGWPMLIFAVLGLADMIFDLRGRSAARRGPPGFPKS